MDFLFFFQMKRTQPRAILPTVSSTFFFRSFSKNSISKTAKLFSDFLRLNNCLILNLNILRINHWASHLSSPESAIRFLSYERLEDDAWALDWLSFAFCTISNIHCLHFRLMLLSAVSATSASSCNSPYNDWMREWSTKNTSYAFLFLVHVSFILK